MSMAHATLFDVALSRLTMWAEEIAAAQPQDIRAAPMVVAVHALCAYLAGHMVQFGARSVVWGDSHVAKGNLSWNKVRSSVLEWLMDSEEANQVIRIAFAALPEHKRERDLLSVGDGVFAFAKKEWGQLLDTLRDAINPQLSSADAGSGPLVLCGGVLSFANTLFLEVSFAKLVLLACCPTEGKACRLGAVLSASQAVTTTCPLLGQLLRGACVPGGSLARAATMSSLLPASCRCSLNIDCRLDVRLLAARACVGFLTPQSSAVDTVACVLFAS
jgi:hypothetical protein